MIKKEYLPSINGLRALSILLVVLNHINVRFGVFDDLVRFPHLNEVLYFLRNGHLGVNVFFIISGFLITFLLLKEEGGKQVSILHFYKRRVFRIFPAYYGMLLIYFILQFNNFISISNSSWLTALTFTKYINWGDDWLTAHLWSLGTEEQFYLIWPLVFVFLKKWRKTIVLFIILMVPVFRLISHNYEVSWMQEHSPLLRMDSIAIGCLAALFYKELIAIPAKFFKIAFYCSLIGIVFFWYFQVLTAKLGFDWIWIPLGTRHGTITNFMVAIILLYSVNFSKGIWFSFLNSRILNYIGMISFSIYLWQQILLTDESFIVWNLPFQVILILIVSSLSYYFIEKPFLKRKGS